jgi:hypothetical protein
MTGTKCEGHNCEEIDERLRRSITGLLIQCSSRYEHGWETKIAKIEVNKIPQVNAHLEVDDNGYVDVNIII